MLLAEGHKGSLFKGLEQGAHSNRPQPVDQPIDALVVPALERSHRHLAALRQQQLLNRLQQRYPGSSGARMSVSGSTTIAGQEWQRRSSGRNSTVAGDAV